MHVIVTIVQGYGLAMRVMQGHDNLQALTGPVLPYVHKFERILADGTKFT